MNQIKTLNTYQSHNQTSQSQLKSKQQTQSITNNTTIKQNNFKSIQQQNQFKKYQLRKSLKIIPSKPQSQQQHYYQNHHTQNTLTYLLSILPVFFFLFTFQLFISQISNSLYIIKNPNYLNNSIYNSQQQYIILYTKQQYYKIRSLKNKTIHHNQTLNSNQNNLYQQKQTLKSFKNQKIKIMQFNQLSSSIEYMALINCKLIIPIKSIQKISIHHYNPKINQNNNQYSQFNSSSYVQIPNFATLLIQIQNQYVFSAYPDLAQKIIQRISNNNRIINIIRAQIEEKLNKKVFFLYKYPLLSKIITQIIFFLGKMTDFKNSHFDNDIEQFQIEVVNHKDYKYQQNTNSTESDKFLNKKFKKFLKLIKEAKQKKVQISSQIAYQIIQNYQTKIFLNENYKDGFMQRAKDSFIDWKKWI